MFLFRKNGKILVLRLTNRKRCLFEKYYFNGRSTNWEAAFRALRRFSKTRVAMQADEDNQLFVMIADMQALTDNAKNPEKVSSNVLQVALTI